MTCKECGAPTGLGGARGRTPSYCSSRCRQRAYRRRKRIPIPKVMTSQARWVRADGKRPIMVDGSSASSTNHTTWASYEDVHASTRGDGFGFMLGGGIGCYDLDHCIEAGVLADWAKAVIPTIVEPVIYAEVSQSGTGLHMFVEADEAPGRRIGVPGGVVERYTRERFIRCGAPTNIKNLLE